MKWSPAKLMACFTGRGNNSLKCFSALPPACEWLPATRASACGGDGTLPPAPAAEPPPHPGPSACTEPWNNCIHRDLGNVFQSLLQLCARRCAQVHAHVRCPVLVAALGRLWQQSWCTARGATRPGESKEETAFFFALDRESPNEVQEPQNQPNTKRAGERGVLHTRLQSGRGRRQSWSLGVRRGPRTHPPAMSRSCWSSWSCCRKALGEPSSSCADRPLPRHSSVQRGAGGAGGHQEGPGGAAAGGEHQEKQRWSSKR